MKVLHITNNYPTKENPIFGIFVKEQIDSLSRHGIENDVFFINGREKGKIEYIKCTHALKLKVQKGKYDLIHCHHAFSALVAVVFLKLNKVLPIVISFQNDPVHETKINLFSVLSRKSDVWIFKNNSIYAVLPKGYYLPNGVDVDFFKPINRIDACRELNIDPQKRYILFVSSNFIRKQKRYDVFSEVIKRLKSTKGYEDVEELKLINVKRDFVPYFFSAASIHLLTSDFEGSPNSVKEAMASNLPVVTTNVGNVSDLLSGVSGSFIVHSNDINQLVNCVKKALANNQLNSREKLIEKGLDINSVANKLKEIYLKLI